MRFYLKPEYFQIIHYYFFSLGVFSLTIAFMFQTYNIYSYIFIVFYIVHSSISWYMSWFMHSKMKLVFIINNTRYALNHVALTVVSGGSAVGFYYLFEQYYESMMTSIMTINFFVVFLGFLWFLLGMTKITDKYFDWQEGRRLGVGREMVARFRKKRMIELIDDKSLKEYKWGTKPEIDQLFIDIKRKSERGEDFKESARDVEVKLAELKVEEMERRIRDLETGDVSEADKNLIKSYRQSITAQRKKMMDYEKRFFQRFQYKESGKDV